MAQTKNALIRQQVIDRCLRSSKYYSVKDMMEKFNIALEDASYKPVTSKVSILKDLEKVVNDQELLSFFTPENLRDDVRTKFDELVDSELLSFITTKLDLYNKLTKDQVNTMFKSTWFNELYDRMVSQVR